MQEIKPKPHLVRAPFGIVSTELLQHMLTRYIQVQVRWNETCNKACT
jgi:hypothetical protein